MSQETSDEAVFENETWYNARVESVKFGESAGKNTPGILMRWIVTEGPMAGRELDDPRWITAKNVDKHIRDFTVLEFDLRGSDLNKLPAAILGKEAMVLCRIETFNNTTSAKVSRVKMKGSEDEPSLIAKIAAIFGNEFTKQEEWDKEKKF